MSRFLFVKLTPYIAFSIFWGLIDSKDANKIKQKAFDKGLNLSQKFKKYKAWDKYAEPLIVRQFAFLFGVGNSFIKGLISDNGDNKIINESLNEMKKEIEIPVLNLEGASVRDHM